MSRLLITLLLFSARPKAALAQDGERIARLETKVDAIKESIKGLETKIDNSRHGWTDQWPVGLIGFLWVLDKGGYYIKRKNGNGNGNGYTKKETA